MFVRFLIVFVVAVIPDIIADTQVTIYQTFLAQNGRTHFETDRWDGHNGLDRSQYIEKGKAIGTESGRWLNRDLNSGIFRNTPQDPHHHGYPDPNHFRDPSLVNSLCGSYLEHLHRNGNNSDIVMEIKGLNWPTWIYKSKHGGVFPNNLDAAAEFVVLLLTAVKQCTHGTIPKYFEVMNEPDASWNILKWDQVIQFHKLVAQKLKAKFHGIKVGGPTKTGQVSATDAHDFRTWNSQIKPFLDFSLNNLDFFSFHPYNFFIVEGNSHRFEGINEARLVAFIDLVESYANYKKGHSVPLILSEYGLSQVRGIYTNRSNELIDWAYINQHNSHMFTYLNFRGVIDRAIGFMLAHTELLGFSSLHYSLFNKDGTKANAAKAYQFWHHIGYNHKFLRIDSQFDNNERKVSPLALGNSANGDIFVLLHNYDKSQARIKLNFANHWFSPLAGLSTCQFLNPHKKPVLAEWVSMHVTNGYVIVPEEASCMFQFHAKHNFHNLKTIQETTYYGKDVVSRIQKDCAICIFSCSACTFAVSTTVNIHTLGNVQYARLRLGISLPGKTGGNPTPKTVNHYHQLFEPGRGHEDSRWEVFVYNVPVNNLHPNDNEVKVEFSQASGYVSSVALLVGRF